MPDICQQPQVSTRLWLTQLPHTLLTARLGNFSADFCKKKRLGRGEQLSRRHLQLSLDGRSSRVTGWTLPTMKTTWKDVSCPVWFPELRMALIVSPLIRSHLCPRARNSSISFSVGHRDSCLHRFVRALRLAVFEVFARWPLLSSQCWANAETLSTGFYTRKVKYTQETFCEKFQAILDGFPRLQDIHPFRAYSVDSVRSRLILPRQGFDEHAL